MAKFEKVPPYLMGANLQIGCMEFLRLLCKAKVIKKLESVSNKTA
jgi:hypothetical protein